MTWRMALKPVAPALALAVSLSLAGCGETNLVRDAAQGVGLAGRPSPAADFVQQSRPQDVGYLPVGVSAPDRPAPRRTAADFKQLEADLELRKAQVESAAASARAAGATPPPRPLPPAPTN
jgi:hypothetical protein